MSTPDSSFIGIDVGKSQLDAALYNDPSSHSFLYDPNGLARLLTRIQDISPTLIAVEATGG
jgi:transposase